MRVFASVVSALFRPAKGVDGAAAALKWLWVPLTLLLVISAAAKAGVAAPLSFKATMEQAQEQVEKEQGRSTALSEGEQAEVEVLGQEMGAEQPGGGVEAIVATSAMVFAVLGAVVAVFYTATFFFIAAKTWANTVKYSTMLSVGALSLVPTAMRNFLQAASMTATGQWIQHEGLGALVAPATVTDPPGVAYAFLSQVDIWVVWGVAVLFGALLSQTVGFGRKHAVTATLAFVGLTIILRAVPTLVTGVFLGAM